VQSLSLSLWLFLSRPVTIRVPGLLCRVLLEQVAVALEQVHACRGATLLKPRHEIIFSTVQLKRLCSSTSNIVKHAASQDAPLCAPEEPRRGRMRTADQQKFFRGLGRRVRELRRERGHSQEDMISYGFSARHWQQIETGRPITVSPLLRICAVLGITVERLVRGLDRGICKN